MITQEQASKLIKKAIKHKQESTIRFETWLRERGIQGNVVTL